MAKDNSRYIQFYTPGSAAVKVEVQQEHLWAPLPEPKPEKKITIRVDFASVLGFVVAVCMLVLLTVGITQLNDFRREVAALERHVAQLSEENHTLEETYQAGFNLEIVEQEALDMGMIPAEEVENHHIYVTMPQIEIVEEPTIWEKAAAFLTSLFA